MVSTSLEFVIHLVEFQKLRNIRGQIHHHFTCSFYERRSQKHKKDSQVKQLFALLGSVGVKAAHKQVDEINPKSKGLKWQLFQKERFFVQTKITKMESYIIWERNTLHFQKFLGKLWNTWIFICRNSSHFCNWEDKIQITVQKRLNWKQW